MRKSLVLAVAALSTAGFAALVPAAANAADTTVTFTLSGGSLTLTAPASAALSNATLAVGGTQVSGSLGSTTVSDARGSLAHTVTVTMSSGDFSTTGGSIAQSNVTGYSGAAVPTGVAVAVPTASGQALAGAGSTILQLTGVIGSASASYNPTVTVAVPTNAIAGNYTGTVTQTAA